MSVRSQATRFAKFCGIDRAVMLYIFGRAWSTVAVPVTLFLVGTFLSGEEQGFYYTFGNILSLQIFFELGLVIVILQFASHEKAHLEWTPKWTLKGDSAAKSRLTSLMVMTLRWYSVAALLSVIFILPAGLYFFGVHQGGAHVTWKVPWMWMSIVTAFALCVSPIFAVLEGCGLVADVAGIRLSQAIVSNAVLWFALSKHWGLFAAPMFATASLCCGIAWLAIKYRAFLIDMLHTRRDGPKIAWLVEIWPMQWRIALSWLSGYFIFQLFNPVLFAYQGSVEAGRMGMSLAVMQGLSSLAIIWVYTKIPLFGHLIAKQEYAELDRMFFVSLRRSVIVACLVGMMFCLGVFGLKAIHHPLSQRILDPLPFLLLTVVTIIGTVVQSMACYLRAHKQEPYLMPSLLGGLLIGGSTYVLGRYFGASAIVIGYLAMTIILLPWNVWIFIGKRREWHKPVGTETTVLV